MDFVFLLGRILFGSIFIVTGVRHIAEVEAATKHAVAKNLPQAKNLVMLSGVTFGLGGISTILGIYGDLGALAILLTLIPATWYFHRFWERTDEMARMMDVTHFLKNLSLMGGSLILFSWFAREGAGDLVPYTITDGFFSFS